jgi:CRP/FNR family transcriptional regulator, cyclic AMP receptor protein
MSVEIAVLAEHPFLAGLSEAPLRALAPLARPAAYDEGHRLFREDGPAKEFWLVRSGRVALDIHVPGRGTVPIETIGAGGVIGWSWLFAPYRWHFGALTLAATEGIRFDAAGVRDAMRDDATGRDLATRFMAVVVDRLQHTRMRLLDLYGAAPGRVS